MAVVDVTEPEFAGIIENNELVILDFWAEWCGPCKAYGPVFKRVSEDHPEVVFAKIDTEQEQALSQSFGIRSIPTTIAFKDGIGVFMMPGALPEKDLRELVTKLNEIDMDEVRAQIAADEATGGENVGEEATGGENAGEEATGGENAGEEATGGENAGEASVE